MTTDSAKKRKRLKVWLWSGAALVFLMVVIGGITRLTGSGLSITEWDLVMGTVPPLNQAEWVQAFEKYRQFPEYRQVNAGMSLTEFKGIYFWEYLHRLIGRLAGLVFLLPFAWFWWKGYFGRRMIRRLGVLFLLGASQGAVGWLMVKSGLADVPYVSHYRLAVHLLLAFVLFGYCIWLAREVAKEGRPSEEESPVPGNSPIMPHKAWIYTIGFLIGVQVAWGALTAGLKAGYIYNTFPSMNGAWLPQYAWAANTAWLSLVEVPGMVQWTHRLLGTILALTAILFWIRMQFMKISSPVLLKAGWLMGGILMQYLLGVLTLLFHVPIVLGVAHQAMALAIWALWIVLYQDFKKKKLLINKTKLS